MDNITLAQVLAWLIIGGLAGSLAARIFVDRRRGFGLIGNIAIGLIGAFIGGFIFEVLDISIFTEVISLDDIIAALLGTVILLAAIAFIRR